jgi:pilus assembly protein CpaE
MNEQMNLLIAGRTRPEIELVESILGRGTDFHVQTRLISNGHADPLHGASPMPDLLVMVLSDQWEEELRSLAAYGTASRPRILALGPDGDMRIMRMAMQAGVRDFLPFPPQAEELMDCVARVAHEVSLEGAAANGTTVAVINAKGGSGASLLACSLAHILVAHYKQRVALVDMDLQFGMLPVYLNMPIQDNLLEALANADHLDTVALKGHMLKHESGLHLLPSMSDHVPLPWEMSRDKLELLMECATASYDNVIYDLPRLIDPLTSLVLERADKILVVMQQNVTHLRDAKRLFHVITKELLVPAERLKVVLNRYDKKSPVNADDIKETLKCGEMYFIPNDFARASQAINLGTPLYKNGRNAPITRSIIDLAQTLLPLEEGQGKPRRRGALAQLFGG